MALQYTKMSSSESFEDGRSDEEEYLANKQLIKYRWLSSRTVIVLLTLNLIGLVAAIVSMLLHHRDGSCSNDGSRISTEFR